MNNEPVAWMNTRISDDRVFLDWEKTKLQNYLSIPLYTHPVKEQLTDEEISKLYSKNTIMKNVPIPKHMLEFARALLREASEKC